MALILEAFSFTFEHLTVGSTAAEQPWMLGDVSIRR